MAGTGDHNNGLIATINVTPLVDVTLVLLIIFIVTAKMIMTPAVPMDLPQASHSEELQVVFSVLVPKSGVVLVDGEPASDDATLLALAQRALARSPDLRAVINADGEVPHRRVIHILDLLKQAGMTRVAFGSRDEAAP